jgi:hypothetical protein
MSDDYFELKFINFIVNNEFDISKTQKKYLDR